MWVTTKGQVTIPQEICEKLGITPAVEIDFIEEKDQIYLVKREGQAKKQAQIQKIGGESQR